MFARSYFAGVYFAPRYWPQFLGFPFGFAEYRQIVPYENRMGIVFIEDRIETVNVETRNEKLMETRKDIVRIENRSGKVKW